MKKNGFSLLELLVVIGVFSLLATVSTQIVAQSLRSTRKSETSIEVRENVDYMFAIMERVFRNSQALDCLNSTNRLIEFIDEDGNSSNFQCQGSSSGRILYNGENISGEKVSIDCTKTPIFKCNQTDGQSPASIEINIMARDAEQAGREGAVITNSTKIILRSY